MQKRARSTLILTALAVASLLLWLATPAPLVVIAVTPALPADVDRHIAKNEQLSMASYGLIPGTEKRVRWQRAEERTHYAIVYLPGFSATRQEIAPTAELVADALGANLFETRVLPVTAEPLGLCKGFEPKTGLTTRPKRLRSVHGLASE